MQISHLVAQDQPPSPNNTPWQKHLEAARKVDDRIQNELNTRLPVSAYFRSQVDPRRICQDLFASLRCAHAARESAIRQCIHLTDQEVKAALEAGGSALGKPHYRLRQLQNELYEEEIIQGNTYKFLYERCRDVFVPSDLPPQLKLV